MPESIATLMHEARRARSERRLEEARVMLVQAVSSCRSAGATAALIGALKASGQIERDLGHGDAALSLYEEAVAICRTVGDPLALAHTVRHAGDIHLDAGRLDTAQRCYHEALSIYREQPQTPALDLANALRPLAILRQRLGAAGDAKRLWTEARDLYAAANVQEGVAESEARLAQLSNIRQITPFLHVPDLAKALDLFTRVLRFEVKFRMVNYAYLENGDAAVRILEEPGRAAPLQGEKTRMTIYIDVRDVDALYSELLPELKTLPPGDVQAPVDQSWNQREFQVRLPDGQWLAFGQAVSR